MASTRWEWSAETKRYRDKETGRFLSATKNRELRDDFMAAQRDQMATASRRMAAGDLSLKDWEAQMQAAIKASWGVNYSFGRGGRNALTADDRAAIADLVKDQFTYLRGFAQDAAAGKLSAAQIEARAELYGNASGLAFDFGRAAAYVGLRLPAMPGMGTICRSNCLCFWRIEEDDTEWRAYWSTSARESCDTCVGRRASYQPYVQAKTQERMLRVVA